jgi:hypothetical protein
MECLITSIIHWLILPGDLDGIMWSFLKPIGNPTQLTTSKWWKSLMVLLVLKWTFGHWSPLSTTMVLTNVWPVHNWNMVWFWHVGINMYWILRRVCSICV